MKTLLISTDPIYQALDEIRVRVNVVAAEVRDAESSGPIELARAYIALRNLKDKIEETFETFNKLHDEVKDVRIPTIFDAFKIPSVNLEEGYRVTVAQNVRAHIRKGMKDAAHDWLRANGMGDIIVGTVNASTLAALARTMGEENRELDSELFNVHIMPTTSVVARKKNAD